MSTSDETGTEDTRDLSGGASGSELGEPRGIHTGGAAEPEAPGGPDEPDESLEKPPPLA